MKKVKMSCGKNTRRQKILSVLRKEIDKQTDEDIEAEDKEESDKDVSESETEKTDQDEN